MFYIVSICFSEITDRKCAAGRQTKSRKNYDRRRPEQEEINFNFKFLKSKFESSGRLYIFIDFVYVIRTFFRL